MEMGNDSEMEMRSENGEGEIRREMGMHGVGALIEKGMGNSRLYDGCDRLNVLCDGTPFLTP